MDKFKKLFRAEVKSFDEKTHRATIFISTGDIDRDQEVIEPKAFQKRLGNYLAHPVLLSSHRADQLTRQIGQAHDLKITDQGVEGDYEWYVGKGNPEADWGWFLVTKGIAAFSVGFMAFSWLDKYTQPQISAEDLARGIRRRFTEIELLENSQVLVPANPQALQRRISEAQGDEKELCELVVKSVKEDEFKPFEGIKELHISGVTEEEKKPKHYSEALLGAGAEELKQTPTKEKPKSDAKVQEKPKLNTNEVIDAVKSGVKEGIKT